MKPKLPLKSAKEKQKLKLSEKRVKHSKMRKNRIITSQKPITNLKKSQFEDLEEKYIKLENVKNAIKGVIKLLAENPNLPNQLFQEKAPLLLQICCHRIPRGHSKILRIPLKNSILTPDDEICLIVPEVKGIKNIEHEKHVEHYEELLRQKHVVNIKKIMTCHELRTEYETFEQRGRLVDLYDVFLVDGRVSGKVVKKCGKIFYKKRKVPISIKLQASKLKEHIEKALSKEFCHLHLKGDSYTVQFGHNKMNIEKLVENIYSIVDYLNKEFPGSFENIKGLQVYASRATSIPIYLSLKSANEIEVSKVKHKKPRAYKTYKDELSTSLNSEVIVKPSGQVTVRRKMNKEQKQVDTEKINQNINSNKQNDEEANVVRKKEKIRKRKSDETQLDIDLKKQKIIKQKATYKTSKDGLLTSLNSEVKVKPSGQITVFRKTDKEQEQVDTEKINKNIGSNKQNDEEAKVEKEKRQKIRKRTSDETQLDAGLKKQKIKQKAGLGNINKKGKKQKNIEQDNQNKANIQNSIAEFVGTEKEKRKLKTSKDLNTTNSEEKKSYPKKLLRKMHPN